MVPELLTALRGTALSSAERACGISPGHLACHDGRLGRWPPRSGGPSGATTCRRSSSRGGTRPRCPWVRITKASRSRSSQASLDEDLEAWTLGDPANPAFALPSGERRTAPQVMRQAFATAVAHLSSVLGGAPPAWAWGRLHSRAFPALSGTNGLGYGPRRGWRRPVHAGRRRRRADRDRRAELADDRHAVTGRGERAGRVPGRPEREPRLALVREPDPAVVGRPVPAPLPVPGPVPGPSRAAGRIADLDADRGGRPMADPRRLGKRGAYRLGELRTAGPPAGARSRPDASRRSGRGDRAARCWPGWPACAVTAALLDLGAGLRVVVPALRGRDRGRGRPLAGAVRPWPW